MRQIFWKLTIFFKALAKRFDQRCWIKHSVKMKYCFLKKQKTCYIFVIIVVADILI